METTPHTDISGTVWWKVPTNIIALGIALLAIFALIFLAVENNSTEDVDAVLEEQEETLPASNGGGNSVLGGGGARVELPTLAPSGEAVVVQSQQAGGLVRVDSVTITRPSWVVVREEGWILGAARLDQSATEVTVPLLRETESGNTYEVVVYVDDGDKEFDHLADVLVSGVFAPFVAK